MKSNWYLVSHKILGLVFLGSTLLGACTNDWDEIQQREAFPGKVKGLRPVYMSKEEMSKIESGNVQDLKNPGKIYVRGHFLFINERGKGIHIIDNKDPVNPDPVSFIHIYGNVDMAVTGNFLYADNGPDMVTLDITDPYNVKVLKRIENIFPQRKTHPEKFGYFECVDPSKGIVVDWEEVTLYNPECYR
jgi:hypothetical protein